MVFVQTLIILGSQSVLGQFPDLSQSTPIIDHAQISFLRQNCEILLRSIEADILIPDSPEIIISKLYAGRNKDIEFFYASVNLNLFSREILLERLNNTVISEQSRKIIENYIKKGFSK